MLYVQANLFVMEANHYEKKNTSNRFAFKLKSLDVSQL